MSGVGEPVIERIDQLQGIGLLGSLFVRGEIGSASIIIDIYFIQGVEQVKDSHKKCQHSRSEFNIFVSPEINVV